MHALSGDGDVALSFPGFGGTGVPIGEDTAANYKGFGHLGRRERNWGANIAYGFEKLATPKTIEQLQAAVREAKGVVRVVGRGHADTELGRQGSEHSRRDC